jgi:hypothetical protein
MNIKAIKEAYKYEMRSFATSRKPRIVSIRQLPFADSVEIKADARFALHDDAVRLFIAWAFIAPAVPLAALLWVRYPALRLFAVGLFLFSALQFVFGLSLAGFALNAAEII